MIPSINFLEGRLCMKQVQETLQPRYVKDLAFLYFLSPLFFIGTILPLSSGIFAAIPLAGLMSLPFLYLYDRYLMRRSLPLILRLMFMALAVFLGMNGLYGFSRFVKTCVMPDTPILLLPLALLLFAVWIAWDDIHVLERFSRITAPIVLILLALSILSAATKIEPAFAERPRLSLHQGNGGFFSMLWLIFFLYLAEGLILLTLLRQQFKVRDCPSKEKPPAIFAEMTKGLLLGGLVLSLAYWVTILALGSDVFEILTYPIYYPPGLTKSAEYLERTEILLLAVFLFTEFLRTGVFLMLLKEGLLAIYTAFGNDESQNT